MTRRGTRAAAASELTPADRRQIEHPDGRVELVDTSRVDASPLSNHDLAPVPLERRNWTHVQLRGAVDQHGALHSDVHARVGTDRRRA